MAIESDHPAVEGGGDADARVRRVADRFHRTVVDLIQRAWAELGLYARATDDADLAETDAHEPDDAARDLRWTAVDPECLLVLSDVFLEEGSPLSIAIESWRVQSSGRLDHVRLRHIVTGGRRRPHVFLELPPRRRSVPTFDMRRPSCLAFRLRAALGVGARAEAMGYLLAEPTRWRHPVEIATEALYSPRALAVALGSLRDAGWVDVWRESRADRFRLAEIDALTSVFGPLPRRVPRWFGLQRALRAVRAHLAGPDPLDMIRLLALAQRIDDHLRRCGLPLYSQNVWPDGMVVAFERWVGGLGTALPGPAWSSFATP